MPARKRNRVVIALAKPDTKDEGLATANRFLLPWYSETTLVHVADRPAVAKAAADSPDKKVADAKRSNTLLTGSILQRSAMASAAPRTVEEGLVGTSVQMEEAARQRLAADFTPVVRMLNRQGYPTRMSIRFGDPVVEISKEAKVRDADLTILATRDRSGLSRLLSSSVPEGVLHSSDIPVLLAHAK